MRNADMHTLPAGQSGREARITTRVVAAVLLSVAVGPLVLAVPGLRGVGSRITHMHLGWIGMAVYFYAFIKPVILLRPEHGALALKVAVATLFFLFYISVSELFLPTNWMFLGLAYWQLDQQKYRRKPAAARNGLPGGYLLPTGQA